MRLQLTAPFAFWLAACVATPTGPPDQMASEIVTALEDGQTARAVQLFESVGGSTEYRERIYPVLFDAASSHWEEGDAASAAHLLRFMRERYSDAVAVREGLLYCLSFERSQMVSPEPALMAEMEDVLAELAEREHAPSPWIDLVQTQLAVDKGKLPEARGSFDRFLARWDGQPAVLLTYVEDLDRYFASH